MLCSQQQNQHTTLGAEKKKMNYNVLAGDPVRKLNKWKIFMKSVSGNFIPHFSFSLNNKNNDC